MTASSLGNSDDLLESFGRIARAGVVSCMRHLSQALAVKHMSTGVFAEHLVNNLLQATSKVEQGADNLKYSQLPD